MKRNEDDEKSRDNASLVTSSSQKMAVGWAKAQKRWVRKSERDEITPRNLTTSKKKKKGSFVSFVRLVMCRYSSMDDVVWVLFSFSTWRVTKQNLDTVASFIFIFISLNFFFCTFAAYPDEFRLFFIISQFLCLVDFEFLCLSTRFQRVADSRLDFVREEYTILSLHSFLSFYSFIFCENEGCSHRSIESNCDKHCFSN